MNRLDSVDASQRRTDIPDFAPGDTVRVQECRPMSRLKRWRLLEVLERAR